MYTLVTGSSPPEAPELQAVRNGAQDCSVLPDTMIKRLCEGDSVGPFIRFDEEGTADL